MRPKKIYLNYVDESDLDKTWSEEPVSVCDCKMKNREYTDLSQVWHDASEEPMTESTRVLATDEKGFIDVFSLEKGKFKIPNGCIPWSSIVVCFNLTKWAYVSDLLPKGGKK